MAEIKITQQMIDYYRSKPGNAVLLDSTIIDLIKKDIETGKLPKQFATLASDAQKTGYNATSSNLFGYGFGADSNMGLSFERTTKISYEHIEQKVCSPVTIAMNIQKFSDKNGVLTTDITILMNIIEKDISSTNIVGVLEEYKKLNDKSLLDTIVDYKMVDDNIRKKLVSTLYSKLLEHVKLNDNNVELLSKLGFEEISYQFDKVGLINKENINAFFDSLIIINNKKHLTNKEKAEMASKYIYDTELPKNIISKKETLEYREENVSQKTINYNISDGRDVIEKYRYKTETQKFILESREIVDKKNNKTILATFHENGTSLAQLCYAKMDNNGNTFRPYEIHNFDKKGKETSRSLALNSNTLDYSIEFNKEGNISEIEKELQDGSIERVSYTNDGTEYNDDLIRTLYKTKNPNEFLSSIMAIYSEDLSLVGLDMMSMLQYNFERNADMNMQRNIAVILFDKCEKYYLNNNSIKDLKERCLKYIKSGEARQAWECCRLACARATQKENIRLIDKSKSDVIINGRIDTHFRQGNYGTCWLTSVINTLSLTDKGRQILKETVKQDPVTGDIIVNLKGVPSGKRTYKYTSDQIKTTTEFSSGDGDARAIEMAVRDYFLQQNKYQVSTNGNNLEKAFELLTGKEPTKLILENSTSFDNKKNSPEIIKDIKEKLDSLIGKELLAECSFVTDFYRKEPKTFEALNDIIFTGHAYTLKKVEEDFVYIVNPHDTSKDLKIDRNTFEKFCGGVTILNL